MEAEQRAYDEWHSGNSSEDVKADDFLAQSRPGAVSIRAETYTVAQSLKSAVAVAASPFGLRNL